MAGERKRERGRTRTLLVSLSIDIFLIYNLLLSFFLSFLQCVQYIGCLKVNASMKSLDFEMRSLVAKECIKRVCEAAGLKAPNNNNNNNAAAVAADKTGKTSTAANHKMADKVALMLAETPNMGKWWWWDLVVVVRISLTLMFIPRSNRESRRRCRVVDHQWLPALACGRDGRGELVVVLPSGACSRTRTNLENCFRPKNRKSPDTIYRTYRLPRAVTAAPATLPRTSPRMITMAERALCSSAATTSEHRTLSPPLDRRSRHASRSTCARRKPPGHRWRGLVPAMEGKQLVGDWLECEANCV